MKKRWTAAALAVLLLADCASGADTAPSPSDAQTPPVVTAPNLTEPEELPAEVNEVTEIERYLAAQLAIEADMAGMERSEQMYGARSKVCIERTISLFFYAVRAQFEELQEVDFTPFWDPETEHQQSLDDFVEEICGFRSEACPVLWANISDVSISPEDFLPEQGENVELIVTGNIQLLYPGEGFVPKEDLPSMAGWPISHRIVMAMRGHRWYITEIEYLPNWGSTEFE